MFWAVISLVIQSEVFCYFDNDQSRYAAQDVLNLNQMIREE